MKLSIAILTHNEGHSLKKLLSLVDVARQSYRGPDVFEVVLVDDFSDDTETCNALETARQQGHIVVQRRLNRDFAAQKNAMTDICTGDWILNLDADETIDPSLINNIPLIVEDNSEVEAFWFPRKNRVIGIGLSHVQKWSWTAQVISEVSDLVVESEVSSDQMALLTTIGAIDRVENGFVYFYEPLVCWPDWQMRLYKKTPDIRWNSPVHERLVGFKVASRFPQTRDFVIGHTKMIERQESQNLFYSKLSTI